MSLLRTDLEQMGFVIYPEPSDHLAAEDIILICGHKIYNSLCLEHPSLATTRVLYLTEINRLGLQKYFKTI